MITLNEHDAAWAVLFTELERRIRTGLGRRALLIEHVGSTAVAGLRAKPVIDVLLAVRSSAEESAYVPPLQRAGCILALREPDWFEHRLLKWSDIDSNVHVFSQGCEEIVRMLAFRDWLRGNAADRQLYERAKQELAKQAWPSVQAYADAKSPVISRILARAAPLKMGSHAKPEWPQ